MTKKSTGVKDSVSVSRAVEEPIDATFELGDELERQASQLTQTFMISIICCIFIILLFVQNIYDILIISIDILRGNASINYSELSEIIISGLISFRVVIVSSSNASTPS